MIARDNVVTYGVKNSSLNDLLGCLVGSDDVKINDIVDVDTPEELMLKVGITRNKAEKVFMLMEFAKKFNCYKKAVKVIQFPSDVWDLLGSELRYESQEHFYVICLNVRSGMIGKPIELTKGTTTAVYISTQLVYKYAILNNAQKIIVVHNHPSGDPNPSRDDKILTKELVAAGKVFKICLVDHVIIGNGEWYSFKNCDLL